MKKSSLLVVFVCVLVLCLGLVACSSGKSDDQKSKDAFTGMWELVESNDNGKIVTEDQIAHMRDLGYLVELNLNQDLTAQLIYGETTLEGTWVPKTATEATFKNNDEEVPLVLNDKGRIEMTQGNQTLTFAVKSASSSSASASSSASSASASASSASASSASAASASASSASAASASASAVSASASAASESASAASASASAATPGLTKVALKDKETIADNDVCKIVVVGSYFDENDRTMGYELQASNKADGAIRINCQPNTFSVKGTSCESWIDVTIDKGKSSTIYLGFDADELDAKSIDDLADVEGVIRVDGETSEILELYNFQM